MPTDAYDLSPNKVEMFKSQSGDLSLVDAVRELIDNAIDNWSRTSDREETAVVRVDAEAGTTYVRDNTGGVPSSEMQALFAPGETRDKTPEWSIGGYALGAKKAISRLGGLGEGTFESARIKSRAGNSETAYGYCINRQWFEKDDWWVDKRSFSDVDEGSTEITVKASESLWNEERITSLKQELSRTYVKFLTGDAQGQVGNFEIVVNGEQIDSNDDVEWSYLPLDDLYPRRYTNLEIDASYLSTPIEMELEVGLMLNSTPSEGGTDIYFQDRLVLGNDTSEDGGFGAEESSLGRFEARHNRLRVKLELHTTGDASELPWDTQKKNIDRTTRVSSEMYETLSEFVGPYFKADSSLVSDAVATPYHRESDWAANNGSVKSVDASGRHQHDRPSKHLHQVNQLQKVVYYHERRGVYVDYNQYDRLQSDLLDKETVPAYSSLVRELSDELEPVTPKEGKQIVNRVHGLRQALRGVPNVGNTIIENIIEGGYTSAADLHDASVFELTRVQGIGTATAEKIKQHLSPAERIEPLLESLAAKPTEDDGSPDDESVFDIYEELIESDALPSSTEADSVIEDGFPMLTSDGEYAPAASLYIPDDKDLFELFEDTPKLQFTGVPDTTQRDIEVEKVFELLAQLGASRISAEIKSSTYARGAERVGPQDPTPQKRLEEVWDDIEHEITMLDSIDCPEVIWVEETGVRYHLGEASREQPSNCEYDVDEAELYLTPDFVVDWDSLADQLVTKHRGDKAIVTSLLREAPGGLEDRAVEIVRRHESEHFKSILDVRDINECNGVNVEGCDVVAFPHGGGKPRLIEIKARTSPQSPIHLIGREPDRAKKGGQHYYLYVVLISDRTDSVRLWRLSDPANREFEPETVWRFNQRVWQKEGEEVAISLDEWG